MQDNLWQAVLGEVELSVSHASFITWFKQTTLLKNKGGLIIIGVPNVFIKQQLENKYTGLISDLLQKNGVKPEGLHFKIHSFSSGHPSEVEAKQFESKTTFSSDDPLPAHLTVSTQTSPTLTIIDKV